MRSVPHFFTHKPQPEKMTSIEELKDERKVANPCQAQVGVTIADMQKKNKLRAPEQICGDESCRLHTPGTKDGKRYCEFHYDFLKENSGKK